jgi:AcrR family transcriptional regulator
LPLRFVKRIAKTVSNPAPSGYHAHRERQRQRILDAAEVLFDKRGIDRVSMADITSASGIRASTLYQYFSKKDDIVWELVSELFASAGEQAVRRMAEARTGLAKITALLEFMADELENEPAKVRFMAQFDAMYARDWPAERLLTLEERIRPQGFRSFGKLIGDGIADGSLRSDLDPNLTMQAIMNAVIGAQRRLASLGNKVEVEYKQPVDRLFRETIRLILLGLRADKAPSASKAGPPSKIPRRTNPKRFS